MTNPSRDLEALDAFGPILAVKVYRVALDRAATPLLPCLDHEATLHQRIAPHVAAYIQDRVSEDIHEIVLFPGSARIDIDTVSTIGEYSSESQRRLLETLHARLPDYAVTITRPSWWRGEQRVAAVSRAQLTLRDALLANGPDVLKRRIDRLLMIASLMEKQSRVTSWGIRTITGQLLAAIGIVLYGLTGVLGPRLGDAVVTDLRYAIVGFLGAVLLYYGVKAVQLTDISNRVWKRGSEYSLILAERQRLGLIAAADAPSVRRSAD